MNRNAVPFTLLLLGMWTTVTFAGIPQPDAVLYGNVFIDGQQVTAQDDVSIVARVAGASEPVAYYQMGQNLDAGDGYVLRLRIESLADGSNQSDNAAVVGQTAQIYIRQGSGPEELVEGADLAITRIGLIEQRDLGGTACTAPQPVLEHSAGGGLVTAPCSGYIDPRAEGDVTTDGCPGGATFGVSTVVLEFNTDVFQSDGTTPVDASSFSVVESGGGAAPSIASVTPVDGDHSLIQIDLDRAITLAQWTTIIASDVYNQCGVKIDNSGGNMGDVNEPDRVDLAFYPGDIDQNGRLEPFDVLAYRLYVQNGEFPSAACNDDPLLYFDIDRNGSIEPFDLLELRLLVGFGCTQDWNNAPPLQARP